MGWFEETRVGITDILNINLVDKPFLFLDIWSLVHLSSGMLLMYFLFKIKIGKFYSRYFLLLGLLIIYEIIEFIFYGVIKSRYFIPETFINVLGDIKMGLIGGWITNLIFWLKDKFK